MCIRENKEWKKKSATSFENGIHVDATHSFFSFFFFQRTLYTPHSNGKVALVGGDEWCSKEINWFVCLWRWQQQQQEHHFSLLTILGDRIYVFISFRLWNHILLIWAFSSKGRQREREREKGAFHQHIFNIASYLINDLEMSAKKKLIWLIYMYALHNCWWIWWFGPP